MVWMNIWHLLSMHSSAPQMPFLKNSHIILQSPWCVIGKLMIPVAMSMCAWWHRNQQCKNHVSVRQGAISIGNLKRGPVSPASSCTALPHALINVPVTSCLSVWKHRSAIICEMSCSEWRLGISRPWNVFGPCNTVLGKCQLTPNAGKPCCRIGFIISLLSFAMSVVTSRGYLSFGIKTCQRLNSAALHGIVLSPFFVSNLGLLLPGVDTLLGCFCLVQVILVGFSVLLKVLI